MFDLSRVAIVISTHNRPAYLHACAKGWVDSAPNYWAMHVLVHHPDGAAGFELPPRARVISTGRVPEHAGCMSKTWNLGMQWAFRDPEVEWCLCSMDDAVISPGWPEVVGKYKHDCDLFMAPAGDLVFLLNRRALREVGWFDERFPLVAFQEWDWEARAIKALGLSRVSIDDAHGWHHNGIGLGAYWAHLGDGGAQTSCNRAFDGVACKWLQDKWGMDMWSFKHMLASGQITEPKAPEIEWYPWFPR